MEYLILFFVINLIEFYENKVILLYDESFFRFGADFGYSFLNPKAESSLLLFK